MTIYLKHILQPARPVDGIRVLVERTWPAGWKRKGGALNKRASAKFQIRSEVQFRVQSKVQFKTQSKPQSDAHLWLRELAPSADLMQWLGQGAVTDDSPYGGSRKDAATHSRWKRWLLFRKRYFAELSRPEAIEELEKLYRLTTESQRITLIYGDGGDTDRRRSASKHFNHSAGAAKSDGHEGRREQLMPASESHAVILKQLLEGMPKPPTSTGPERAVGLRQAMARRGR